MTKILVRDPISAQGMNLLQSDSDCLTIDCSEISEPEFLSELADADALVVRSRTRVDPSLLNHAPRLRVVGRAGAGVDNIDLSAATEKGSAGHEHARWQQH